MDSWGDEVASDMEEGLTAAGRFDPTTRHMREVLAFAQLDQAARSWAKGRKPADVDRMVEVLTDSWWHLLAGPG